MVMNTDRRRRLLWFFGLWLASVVTLAVIAGALRWIFGLAMLHPP